MSSLPQPILVSEALSYSYPAGIEALKNIDLRASAGEVIGLVGENGSGKTTLVKHFNGLLKPTRGRILVNGLDTRTHRVEQLSRFVGLAFQNPDHQIFCTTVAEELAFGPTNLRLSREVVLKRVAEAIALFGLLDWQGLHPAQAPFAVRKIVGVASVYTMAPSMLILDEPTSGQDEAGIRLLKSMVNQLRADGSCVLLSSHDIGFVSECCDRVLVLHQGSLQADGPPRQVFGDAQVLRKAGLKPPQVTQLINALGNVAQYGPVLSVDEAVPLVSAMWRDKKQ